MIGDGMDPFGVRESFARGAQAVEQRVKSIRQQMDGYGQQIDQTMDNGFNGLVDACRDSVKAYSESIPKRHKAYDNMIAKGNVLVAADAEYRAKLDEVSGIGSGLSL